MGAVDLVIQVESPGSVARGLQRIGRAGHQVGEPSRGKIFPKYRGDLLEAAVVAQRMRDGLIEETRYPRNPLDVLAQQLARPLGITLGPDAVHHHVGVALEERHHAREVVHDLALLGRAEDVEQASSFDSPLERLGESP